MAAKIGSINLVGQYGSSVLINYCQWHKNIQTAFLEVTRKNKFRAHTFSIAWKAYSNACTCEWQTK